MSQLIRQEVVLDHENNKDKKVRVREVEYTQEKHYDENLKDVPPPYISTVVKVSEGIAKFTRYPRLAWMVSTVALVIGILIIIIGIANLGDDNDTFVVLMIIGGILFFIGTLLLVLPRTEYITINRKEDYFRLRKKNLVCCKKTVESKISEISDVKIIQRGMRTLMQNTIHYKTCILFSNGEEYTLASTKNLEKASETCKILREFIGMTPFAEAVDIENRGDI